MKASTVIQTKAYELLSKNSLKAETLSGIITVNGPGFYTGLRLAEGFSDVFNFFGVKQFSFYSYEIPEWCGYSEGVWFTKAYRGEYFLYTWKGSGHEQKLISVKDLPQIDLSQKYFIHSDPSLDNQSRTLIPSPIHTLDLLESHPEKIFSHVVSGLKREPFYFRAPEDEFKANP